MRAPVNVALLGYGYAGKTFHAPLITAVPELSLHTIVSTNLDLVKHDWPHCVLRSTLQQALDDPEIELVVIATPNDLHYPQARAALLAGKHVVVDKPFTVTLDQAGALCDLAQSCNLVLSVFHNRRWDADFLALKALLASGELGKLSHFESHFDRYRPQVKNRWRERANAGAGLWYDLGPHLLDQVLQLFGVPVAIQASLSKQRSGAEAVDYFHVQLRYPEHQVILHASCLVSGGSPRFSVHGELASYIKFGLDPQEDTLKQGLSPGGEGWGVDSIAGQLYRVNSSGVVVEEAQGLCRGDYRHYYRLVGLAVRGEADNPVPAVEALRVMNLLELGLISSAEGKELLVSN
ncbi:oxidoreductase [Neisseriaceae bacterium TC5R-5]|nr:oxidoreductase [Neisseriaceae bacterium TC5R-5]